MSVGRTDGRLALLLAAPALIVIFGVALVPVGATAWEALHQHDLRLPWLGTPFIGVGNFVEAARDPRFISALGRTLLFAVVTVPLELALGLALALIMHRAASRGAGTRRARRREPARTSAAAIVRVAVLLPWAIPTVVAALVWRFMFEAQTGVVNVPLRAAGLIGESFDWFVSPVAAWVPIVGADVWKTTPFVAVLLLAGLQTIDPELHEAARMDGAGPVRRFATITVPLLRPTLIAAAAFRALDAIRLFDLSYVLTGGGPGTATEPLSLYAFIALMQRLRFGYGSALSVLVFLLAFLFALVCARALGRSALGERA